MSTIVDPGHCAGLDTPDDFLRQAERLFTERFEIAAGMLARSSLEATLKMLCDVHSCLPTRKEIRRAGREAYCDRLELAHVFDRSTSKEVERLWTVGSLVTHCECTDVAVIENLLVDVRTFVDEWAKGGAS